MSNSRSALRRVGYQCERPIASRSMARLGLNLLIAQCCHRLPFQKLASGLPYRLGFAEHPASVPPYCERSLFRPGLPPYGSNGSRIWSTRGLGPNRELATVASWCRYRRKQQIRPQRRLTLSIRSLKGENCRNGGICANVVSFPTSRFHNLHLGSPALPPLVADRRACRCTSAVHGGDQNSTAFRLEPDGSHAFQLCPEKSFLLVLTILFDRIASKALPALRNSRI